METPRRSKSVSDTDLLDSASMTLSRTVDDFTDLSFAEIAALLYSRALISETAATQVIDAGQTAAATDVQQALVKQQQHEALIAALLAPGPIRYFSTALELPFENMKQSYLDAVSDRRRLVGAFMHLPEAQSAAKLLERTLKQTLAGRKSADTENSQALPRYMTRGAQVARTARGGPSTDMRAQREVQAAVNALPAQQRLDFQYARAALEGEIASLDAIIRRQESFLNELKRIAKSGASDAEFDRRMLTVIKKGW